MSPKIISGNSDFALVCSIFFDDSSFLASQTNAVEAFGDFWSGDFGRFVFPFLP